MAILTYIAIILCAVTMTISEKIDLISETLDFLNRGQDALKLANDPNVILILGNTGSGKSTFTHYAAGDYSKIISIEPDDEDAFDYIVYDGLDTDPSNSSTTVSRTVVPELVIDEKKLVWYDCPGFSDTRNISVEITTTYLLKSIVDNAVNLKMVFVVNYGSVTEGYDRIDFDTLLNHATDLIKDVERYNMSVSLIVSKVPSVRLRGRNVLDVSEESAVNSVGEFLKKYRIALLEKSHSTAKVQLVDAFLRKSPAGKYTQIGIFWRPNEAGSFDKIEKLAKGRESVRELIINRTNNSKINEEDFCYTLSDKAEAEIIVMSNFINQNISETLVKIDKQILRALKLNVEHLYGLTDRKDLFTKGEECVKIITQKSVDIPPKELLVRLLNLIKTMNISVPDEDLYNIEVQQKHMNLLQLISKNAVFTPSKEWVNSLETSFSYIRNEFHWYSYLVATFEFLSSYTVQRNITAYNVEELNDWGKLNKPQGLFVNEVNFWEFVKKQAGFFDLLQNIDINSDRLYDLNEIIRILLKTPIKYECNGRTLAVTGEVVKLSDTDKTVCGPKSNLIDSVQVYALNTFYADVDYTFQNNALFAIVTNKFHVVEAVTINLTGSNNADKPEEPIAGTKSRSNGTPGKTGKPGGNGGNFFAFAIDVINGNNLLVNVSGGNGGIGQNGSPAYSEEAPFTIGSSEEFYDDNGRQFLTPYEYRKVEAENSNIESDNRNKLASCPQNEDITFSTRYVLYARQCCRPDGLAGAGGIGGNFGNFKFIQSTNEQSSPLVSKMLGLPGLNGTNVTPCITHKRVVTYQCYCQMPWEYHWLPPVGVVYDPEYYGHFTDEQEITSDTTCSRSEMYTTFNTNGMESPKQVEPLKVVGIVTQFKSFVRQNLKKSIRLNDLRRVYDLIDFNDKLQQLYDISDIAFELVTYENQYYGLSEDVNFLPFYESLLKRIEDFASSNVNSTSVQDRKILASLFTTALAKSNSLRSGRDSNLVIDIGLYLDVVANNIKKLDALGRVKVINEYKDKYIIELNSKIDEANTLIEKDIQPTIEKTFTELNTEMDNVISETIGKEEDTIKNLRERERNIKKLNKNLVLRTVLKGLDILAQIVGSAGPEGKLAGSVIDLGTGIGRQFIVDPNETPDHSVKIPPGVKNVVDHLNESLQKRKQRKIDALTKEIEKLQKELTAEETVERKKIVGTLDEWKKRLEEAKKKEIPDKEEIEKIEADFKDLIGNQIEDVQKDSTLQEKKKEKIIKFFKRTQTALEVIEWGIDTYKEYADDAKKIEAVRDAINADKAAIKELQAFEQNIYENLLPAISQLHDSLETTRKTLGTKSLVALDVQQWTIKEKMTAFKEYLVDSLEGFTSQAAIKSCIDKLANGMDLIIKIYDRIQHYQEQTKMIAYLAKLQTAAFRDIEIADPMLRSLYNSLKITIQSNIILTQYSNAVSGFKQNVFPFADRYFDAFKLPTELTFKSSINDLVSTIVPQLETLIERAKQLNTSVINQDDADIFSAYFGIDENKSMKPFYVWENREFGYEIQQLLEGKQVYLPALVTRGLDVNAVKFNSIGIELRSTNKTAEMEVRKILNPAHISLTHLGNSYYRCGYRFYTVSSPAQRISYSYEKVNGEPAVRNAVYEKLMYNHALLSPYALWNLQLTKIDFEKLKPYAQYIDIELYGHGQYVRQFAEICSTDLTKYYDLDSSISEIDNIAEESILVVPYNKKQYMKLDLIL